MSEGYVVDRRVAPGVGALLTTTQKDKCRMENLMEKSNVIAALKAAGAAGCRFHVGVPSLGGATTVALTPEQVLRLTSDKNAVFAEVLGLTVPEYIEWYESQGSVYCSGRTKQGRQCRNFIVGGIGLMPEKWTALRAAGGYCSTHGA